MDYSPWCLYNTLYTKHGTEIIETDYSEWVVKRMEDGHRMRKEIKLLLSILSNAPRHAIAVPPPACRFYDYSRAGGWYVMKRYTDEVHRNSFCKENWKTLATHVLQFLQDLHHSGKVHMDIKRPNILYDEAACEFVVADYELVQEISSTHTLDLDDDHLWYYLSMGAELTEAVYSWRMDLVALGYILASLSVEPSEWTFEQECYDHRTGSGSMDLPELLDLRAAEVEAITEPLIITYFELIATIEWGSPAPPPPVFYEELEALFSTPSDKPPE